MNTMMKALLACMPAAALAEDVEIIKLNARNMQGSDFVVEEGDALEFHWTGPGEDSPFQQPEYLKIRESALSPAPYSVTMLDTDCQDVTETVSVPDQQLARYVVHANTWVNQPHSEFDGVFTDLQVLGSNDWAYGHNRLWQQGDSRIVMNYSIPYAEIREHYPNASFKLKSGYFAAWNMSDLVIETTVNGHIVHDSVQVAPEHEGRTHHVADLNAILEGDEDGQIVVQYEAGSGPLFLWYFDIWVAGLEQEMSEQMCTLKWRVEPTDIYNNEGQMGHDTTIDTYGTYDLQFTTPNGEDRHS